MARAASYDQGIFTRTSCRNSRTKTPVTVTSSASGVGMGRGKEQVIQALESGSVQSINRIGQTPCGDSSGSSSVVEVMLGEAFRIP